MLDKIEYFVIATFAAICSKIENRLKKSHDSSTPAREPLHDLLIQ